MKKLLLITLVFPAILFASGNSIFSGLNLGLRTGALNFNTIADSPEDDFIVPESNVTNTSGFIGATASYLKEKASYLYGLSLDLNLSNASFASRMNNGSLDSVSNKINGFGSARGVVALKINNDSIFNFSGGVGLVRSKGHITETLTTTTVSLNKNITSLVFGSGISLNFYKKLTFNAGVDYFLGKNYSVTDQNNDKVNISTKLLVPYLGLSCKLA